MRQINELLEEVRETYHRAVDKYQPKAVVIALSGGDDSVATYAAMRELGLYYDAVMHGYTGTGIERTSKFCVDEVKRHGDEIVIADGSGEFEKYCLRKGFPGLGSTAHSFIYHYLKAGPFRKAISKRFRKGRKNYNILFINGARRQESTRRMETMKDPLRPEYRGSPNIWVNIMNNWSKEERDSYLEDRRINRNPISKRLCRSAECNCGTMHTWENYAEAKAVDPQWGKWIDNLRKEVKKKFPWDWATPISESYLLEANGQMNIFNQAQPMCVSCEAKKEQNTDHEKNSNERRLRDR